MSGWDVSSTPTWGSQDGPDDTQAFKASGGGGRGHGQEFGAPEFGGSYPGENAAGGPPPEYFGQDYGQDPDLAYPQRTPGQSFEDLPRREAPRGRHSGGMQAGGDYGQDNGYGQDSAFGQDWGGSSVDQADNWRADGQDNGGWDDGNWGRTAGRPAAPWDEQSHGDAGYGGAGYGDVGYGDADGGGFGQQDFGRRDFGQSEGPGFSAQDYGGPGFPGQQGRGGQEPMDFGYQDPDVAARNDPALQDFFAPAGGPGFSDAGPDWPGGDTPRDRFRTGDEDADWTGRGRTRPPADADWTGRPRGQRPAPRRDDDDDSGGIGTKGLVAIGAVVMVVIAGAAYMFLHKSSASTPTAGSTPTAPASTPAAKSTAPTGKATAATPAYTLVSPLPSKAGPYPLGQDPNFLANAKATAKQIATAMTSGGGKVTGSPESAAYKVPFSQVVTFVGYQGTFTPDNVKSALKSIASDVNPYKAGPNGGVLYCGNTTATPNGAVCVWATSSTLGITEFYNATGPEPLVNTSKSQSQSKGASDTVSVRADVEKKSS